MKGVCDIINVVGISELIEILTISPINLDQVHARLWADVEMLIHDHVSDPVPSSEGSEAWTSTERKRHASLTSCLASKTEGPVLRVRMLDLLLRVTLQRTPLRDFAQC
jgi:hypothetical protein